MREILFRGKRKDNGEWIYGNLTKRDDVKEWEYFIGQNSLGYEVIPETVGQYTGLNDKNRNKIFEGDIIAHFINWHGKRFNGAVRYESKIACWVCDFVVNNKTESAYLADWVCGNGAKVIGNIHDNLELVGNSD